jgi:hypothetical protein
LSRLSQQAGKGQPKLSDVSQRKWQVQPFIIGNNDGYFCTNCPAVVLDYQKFSESAMAAKSPGSNCRFTVTGIIDLDAVPKEKAYVPLDENDTPIPLVQFTNIFKHGLLNRNRRRGKLKKLRRKNNRRK